MISREEEILGQEPANIPTARKASGYSNKRLNRQGIRPSDATPMAKPFMSRLLSGSKGLITSNGGGETMDDCHLGRYAVLATFLAAAVQLFPNTYTAASYYSDGMLGLEMFLRCCYLSQQVCGAGRL